MAQRVAKFARKAPGHRRGEGAERPVVTMRGIDMDVATLLAPYKKRGRLALRVERVPQQARLSHGRNNGDGSWSLALDELEDLQYQYPDGIDGLNPLAIRIIGLDHEASTLALLTYPLTSEPVAIRTDTKISAEDGQMRRLRLELNQTKTALAARESELAKAQSAMVGAPSPRAAIDAELAVARSIWQAESDRILADAHDHEAAMLAQYRSEARAERDAHLAEAQSRADRALADARRDWEQESATSLTRVSAQWREAEEKRLAAAQAQWKAASATALEQVREEFETQRGNMSGAAIGALRQRLDEMETMLSVRDTELLKARASAEASASALVEMRLASESAREADGQNQTLRHHLAEIEAALVESTRKIADAEARADTATAAQENLRRDFEAARGAAIDGQIHALRQDLAETEGRLAARETLLTAMQANAEAEQRRAETALETAQQGWRLAEGIRLAEAEANWQERYENNLAQMRRRLDEAEGALASERQATEDTPEPDLLQSRLDASQSALAASEAALAHLHAETVQKLQTVQREWDQKLANAKTSWKADKATHLASAHALWRQQSASELATATSRYEAAEAALTQLRLEHRKARAPRRDDGDSNRLREDYAALQTALAERDAELEYARSTIEARNIQTPSNAQFDQNAAKAKRQKNEANVSRRLLFDTGVIVLFVVLAIWFYPRIVPLLPDGWQATLTAHGIGTPATIQAPIVAPPKMASLIRSGSLRATPATSGTVVQVIARGRSVAVIEERGKWTLARLEGQPHAVQGWIRTSLLKLKGGAISPSATREKPKAR